VKNSPINFGGKEKDWMVPVIDMYDLKKKKKSDYWFSGF
jgi:hypothetical protein